MELLTLIGVAVVAFASTNIDDIFVLLGFNVDPGFRARDVVVGQFLGLGALFGISVILSWVSLVIPAGYLRLLGLAPILIGGKKLYDVWRKRDVSEAELETHPVASSRLRPLIVATVTIANGGDNIGIYVPYFAGKSALALAVIGSVFVVMTAIWCFAGQWMVRNPLLGAPIRRVGHRVVPFVLMGIGAMVLFNLG